MPGAHTPLLNVLPRGVVIRRRCVLCGELALILLVLVDHLGLVDAAFWGPLRLVAHPWHPAALLEGHELALPDDIYFKLLAALRQLRLAHVDFVHIADVLFEFIGRTVVFVQLLPARFKILLGVVTMATR